MRTMPRFGVASATRLICATAVLCAAPTAWAQQSQGLRASLEGHWILVSAITEKDGTKTAAMGPDPLGLFIFDASDRYAIQLYNQGLPKVASNARNTATADEIKAIYQGSLAHYGTYTVNDKEGSFTIRATGSTFPNWVGRDLHRKFTVTGDELTIFNPASSRDPNAKAYLVLKRAK